MWCNGISFSSYFLGSIFAGLFQFLVEFSVLRFNKAFSITHFRRWKEAPYISTNFLLQMASDIVASSILQWSSAVVDKRIVNKIGDKTSNFEKTWHVDKDSVCQHSNVLFWKRKDTLKKQNIVRISLQKGLTVCEKRAVKRVQRQAWHSAHHCLPGQSRWSIT